MITAPEMIWGQVDKNTNVESSGNLFDQYSSLTQNPFGWAYFVFIDSHPKCGY